MAGPGETNDLDFSSLLVPMTVDVAPLAETEEVQAHALIGAAEIKHGGFCVSLTRDRPKPRAAAPPHARILVVDDEPATAALLLRLLTSAGYQPVLARNGREFVEQLRRPPLPHLVLLDVMLPDIDGIAILARIRSHEVIGQMPVVLLTAQSNLADVARGMMAGADGYLTKPASGEALFGVIKQVLAGVPAAHTD